MDTEKPTGQVGAAPGVEPPHAALSNKGLARRRFSKVGVGSGLVITLASQPGMASSVCKPPSGCFSKGMIASHRPHPQSTGLPPEDWVAMGSWPSPCGQTALLSTILTCKSASYRNARCIDILNSKLTPTGSVQTTDRMKIARLCTAAMLNVKSQRSSSFLSENTVREMWTGYDTSGYYRPNATAKWYAADILFYLTGTMDKAAMSDYACDVKA